MSPAADRDPRTGSDPVVQVRIDSAVPHLDRPFDYLVPTGFAEQVDIGSRVRVRFCRADSRPRSMM